jgi:hypothetical protein
MLWRKGTKKTDIVILHLLEWGWYKSFWKKRALSDCKGRNRFIVLNRKELGKRRERRKSLSTIELKKSLIWQ